MTAPQLLRPKQVRAMLGVSQSQLYKMMMEGRFPRPLKRGRISFWHIADVQKWIEAEVNRARGAKR